MVKKDKSEAVLALLRDAAAAGARCPTTAGIEKLLGKLRFQDTPMSLARAGKIKLEVFAHNFRVITIDGMRTAGCPIGTGKAYLTVDASGEKRSNGVRNQPYNVM